MKSTHRSTHKPRGQINYESFCKSMKRAVWEPWAELTVDEKISWEVAACTAILYDLELSEQKRKSR